jgi:RecB family endonuclease NucS
MTTEHQTIRMSFHGRIIDHLGIQMYQSPVAAIAEIVSNSWDADAEDVWISLPDALGADASIVILDDGWGMTFEECERRYLQIGACRRDEEGGGLSEGKRRPVLGRKGIGKFAGFGIAERMTVRTISKKNGELTEFTLDINQLRTGGYVETGGNDVSVSEYLGPDDQRMSDHGTTITLSGLKLQRRQSTEAFGRSMARRFLLRERAEDFRVWVDGQPLPDDEAGQVEFMFPRDYAASQRPSGLEIDQDIWGVEALPSGRRLRWKVTFYKQPIEDEELRGVAVFSRGKLAQKAFFFNLSGGLGGQHGQEYMSGMVEADFIDDLQEDLIATERQRINWDHHATMELEEWGKARIKELLRIWQDRRGEEKRRMLEAKVASFSPRLERLAAPERRTVQTALTKLGGIAAITDQQFEELGEAILLAWEQGRLHELIDSLSGMETLSETDLVAILMEAKVLTALNLAEAVKTKLEVIHGLEQRIARHELENAVRDYIANNPWLISPQWETFRVEKGITGLTTDAAAEADMTGEDWEGRVDLVLSSGNHLLVLEFMRPGLRLDWDHVSRFERYIRILRSRLEVNTAGQFREVTGFIVADRLATDASIVSKIRDMRSDSMYAMDWDTLLREAKAASSEFLEILVSRAPDDQRIVALSE